jgi:hypothetical protein
MNYYFASGNEQRGPYSLQEMASFGLRPDALVWREGMEQWQRADSIPELLAMIPIADPAPVPTPEPSPAPEAAMAQPVAPVPAPVPSLQPLSQGPLAYGGYTTTTAQPSGMAIASLVLGLVSMLSMCMFHVGAVVGFPCGVLAIVFGFIAKGKANRQEAGGRGMALAGIILGFVYVGLALVFVLAIVGVAIFMAIQNHK